MPARCAKHRFELLHKQQWRLDVNGGHPPREFQARRAQPAGQIERSVVDQDIEPGELLTKGAENLRCRSLGLGKVRANGQRAPSARLKLVFESGGLGLACQVSESKVEPFIRKPLNDGASDPLRAPRNQRHPGDRFRHERVRCGQGGDRSNVQVTGDQPVPPCISSGEELPAFSRHFFIDRVKRTTHSRMLRVRQREPFVDDVPLAEHDPLAGDRSRPPQRQCRRARGQAAWAGGIVPVERFPDC